MYREAELETLLEEDLCEKQVELLITLGGIQSSISRSLKSSRMI